MVSRNFLSIRIFWTVFICSFSILINSQLESDVCRLPYTWSLNSLIWWTAAKSSAKTLTMIDLLTHFWVLTSRFYCWQTSSGISQHIYCVFSLLRPLRKYISCSKSSVNANLNVSEYHASCTRVFYDADGVRSSGSWVRHCSWSAEVAGYKQVILSRWKHKS